jgi:hypothetical protein
VGLDLLEELALLGDDLLERGLEVGLSGGVGPAASRTGASDDGLVAGLALLAILRTEMKMMIMLREKTYAQGTAKSAGGPDAGSHYVCV